MNINVRTTTVIEIQLRELYDNLSNHCLEMLWEDPGEGMCEDLIEDLKSIAQGDVVKIRKLFKDGYTMMMLPPKAFELVEAIISSHEIQDQAPIEIHLFTNHQFLGTVTAEDISY